MKPPYYNDAQRIILDLHRKGIKTLCGGQLELHLAWKKLLREIQRTIFKNK